MLPIQRKSIKNLIFLICIFVSLDMFVLGLNFYLSARLKEDAREINIAGRQRMLSQNIAKNVYQWLSDVQASDARAALSLNELLNNASLFERTLNAFQYGGLVPSTQADQEVMITEASTGEQRRVIADALKIWGQWRSRIYDAVTALNGASSYLPEGWKTPPRFDQSVTSPVFELEQFTRQKNQQLLSLMNELTHYEQQQANQHASLIRFFQIGAFVLALFNFAYIVRRFFSELAISRANQTVLDRIVNNVDASVVVANQENIILHANKTARDFFQLAMSDMSGKRMHDLVSPYKGACFVITHTNRETQQEDINYAKIFSRPLDIHGQHYLIYTITDVTHQVITERTLSKLAYEDPLTGLCNRKMIEDKLDQAIKKAKRYEESFALLYLDLDGFKQVNDNYGHDVGDALLVRIGEILNSEFRESDEVGRIGGDEFLVLCANIREESEVAVICKKLLQQIENITVVEKFRIQVTASIGVALFPHHAENKRELKKAADTAMYRAKNQGKNRFCLAQ